MRKAPCLVAELAHNPSRSFRNRRWEPNSIILDPSRIQIHAMQINLFRLSPDLVSKDVNQVHGDANIRRYKCRRLEFGDESVVAFNHC